MISLKTELSNWLKRQEVADPDLTPPPNSAWGDLSSAWPLKAGKLEKKAPAEIAEALRLKLNTNLPSFLERIEVTAPGFLNFFFTTAALAKAATASPTRYAKRTSGKIVVEHTSINPNKAAHIGHVRNAVLGDTLIRILRATGHSAESQNYIDDTGVQVADVVFAEQFFNVKPPKDQLIDDWAWDIYTKIQLELASNEGLVHQRNEILHLIEKRDPVWAERADKLSWAIVKRHLETMNRLGIVYDALVFESSIISAGLLDKTMDALKKKGVVKYEETGPNAGCSVVPFGGTVKLENGEEKSADKILIKSNGTATYLAKDIAYHLGPAKFAKISAPLKYTQMIRPGSTTERMWVSRQGTKEAPVGGASQTITPIDNRQSYLQDVLREALVKLGYSKVAENAIHFAYEVVSLSGASARALGVTVEDDSKAVAMSGRKGIGIKANTLIDAAEKVIAEHTGSPELLTKPVKTRGLDRSVRLLARAAVRYAMLRQSPSTAMTFDLETATRSTGDTGVYLCYALIRAKSILKKTSLRVKTWPVRFDQPLLKTERALLLALGRFPDVLEQSALNLAPSDLAAYALELATAFTAFYEDPAVGRILKITGVKEKAAKLFLVTVFADVMTKTLEALGIEAPERI